MAEHHVRVKVGGELACFSRPEMKVERVSYEVMTPSAARGVLDAILWRPEMRWVVRRIEVLEPIGFIPLKRNEIQSKIAPKSVGAWMDDASAYEPMPAGAGTEEGTPRNTLALRDVAYVIEAEPKVFSNDPGDTPTKYIAMFSRRVENGQCFSMPCLGCREFAAWFEPASAGDRPIDDTRDLGLMLYDVVFDPGNKTYRPHFFRARLEHGVMDCRPEIALSDDDREEVLACSYRR